MAEITLVAAFSTVPGGEADAIKQLLTDTIQQIAQDDGTFTKARIVFTESDETLRAHCSQPGRGQEGGRARFRLTSSSWRTPSTSPLLGAAKEALRLYFRKVLGR